MDPVPVSEASFVQLGNEKCTNTKLLFLPVNICDGALQLDIILGGSLGLSTSGNNELSYSNTQRAIFTIHIPSSQILVVNSAACQLMNYSSDELCSMKLENLAVDSDRNKILNGYKKLLNSYEEIPHSNGELLELHKKDGDTISVSLFLKRLENPERCLAVIEALDRITFSIFVDENGKILSCDEEITSVFFYEASDVVGLSIFKLLPAFELPKKGTNQKDIIKQQITGRTKYKEVFPVSLEIHYGSPSAEDFEVKIWVFYNLSGVIFLNKKLKISNFNSHFMKLLFGFSKLQILNEPISNLIPTFCTDVEFEKLKGSKEAFCEVDICSCSGIEKTEARRNRGENFSVDESLSIKTSSSLSFNNVTDSPKKDWSATTLDLEPEVDLETMYTHKNLETKKLIQNDLDCFNASQRCAPLERNTKYFMKKKIKSGKKHKKIKMKSDHQKVMVQEGKFIGFAQHQDGNYLDIKYQVKVTAIRDDYFYCIWLTRDPAKVDLTTGFDTHMGSSLNNSSMDGSLFKDSINSGPYTRPSTASLISQSDDNLTAGDYSQYYTNIRQIGKGAFGYVKMAFRNSDGLLVVTKFIKKQSINIRSWVYHSNLSMKIPLEISLLTTLQHPNIVKVLDVFHNDSFVQLVMEKHGAGFDLFEFINRGPKCDEKLKSYIFRQIISAVHYLDSLGILHRDIKDENVIINEKFEIKLIDFGSATFMPTNQPFSKFYGTVEYCSPEVLQGNSYKGPELEIWALGVTLYVLTFGENPFYNIEETIQGQFSLLYEISQELDDLLHRMLDKNVETRININNVIKHSWITQPVEIENYRFEDVVKCSNEEAYPPKYAHELSSKEILDKDSRTDSIRLGDTNNSNGSLQNLAELDYFDDNFQETHKASIGNFPEKNAKGPSIVYTSTPLQDKNDRLCRSANVVTRRSEKFLSLRDCTEDDSDVKFENRPVLKSNYSKDFRSGSSSGNESGDMEELFTDVYDSESEV